MPKKTRDIPSRILEHLSAKSYRPERPRKLARSMGIDEGEYHAFRAAVKELMRAGRVVQGGGNCIMLPQAAGLVIGTFRGHERGFGFVVPSSPTDHEDLFIPPPATLDAITGDTVAAQVVRRGKRGDLSRVEGRVVEIIARGESRFVGELVKDGRQWFLLPDGAALHVPVLVGDVSSSRAKTGDQVVVELTEFPSLGRPARGVIVEVLGRRGDPEIDTISIIREHHLRDEFPEDVLTAARKAVREYDLEAEIARRENLQDEVIITIDPDDAKDFDDAISLRPVGRGGFELGIHIADVSRFVRPGSKLDDEAQLRSNSVYLLRHVIPMLPEILSNGLCSLQENEPRLTKSVFIRYDSKGNRKATRFAEAVIRSRKRLTYREATRILESKTNNDDDPAVVALLNGMDRAARTIQKRRLADGMLVLDLPDVEIILNDDGEVTGVEPADTSFSHTIIEMFMIEANDVVAELLTELGVPHLRRIHPDPPADAQRNLAKFLRVLGKPLPEQLGREDMIRLLTSVRGKPESFAVNLAVLRSMARAEYSPKGLGHFALASRHYSHFTSPIRRYPDLTVHRLIEDYLAGRLRTRKGRASAPSAETLAAVGGKCSVTERRAEAAERELRQVKVLRLLEKQLGNVEEGVVTGVTNVGVFVQLQKYLIDGLIRFEDLADDWWDINTRAGCVIGQQSGKRIAIGDQLRVQIAAVDLAARKLDLVLADGELEPTENTKQRTPKQSKPKRSTTTRTGGKKVTTKQTTPPKKSHRQGGKRRRRR